MNPVNLLTFILTNVSVVVDANMFLPDERSTAYLDVCHQLNAAGFAWGRMCDPFVTNKWPSINCNLYDYDVAINLNILHIRAGTNAQHVQSIDQF
jgi:hypothetical protein